MPANRQPPFAHTTKQSATTASRLHLYQTHRQVLRQCRLRSKHRCTDRCRVSRQAVDVTEFELVKAVFSASERHNHAVFRHIFSKLRVVISARLAPSQPPIRKKCLTFPLLTASTILSAYESCSVMTESNKNFVRFKHLP